MNKDEKIIAVFISDLLEIPCASIKKSISTMLN